MSLPKPLRKYCNIQYKWWQACQMSNTSTIHLQRSTHFSQCTSLFRKSVNYFDASYRDTEPLFEPELTDLHCSDELDLNSNKMMCLLLQLFSYDRHPKRQQRTTVCWSFSGSNSHLTCFKHPVQAQWAYTLVSFNLFTNTLNNTIFVNF